MTAHTFRTDVFSGVKTWNNVNIRPVASYTAEQYDLIVERYGFYDNGGDYATDRSSWALTGYTAANTTAVKVDGVLTQRIYFKATGTTDYVIQGYTDAAMSTGLVISGTESTRSTGSTVTLSAENTSGLSGTVVIGDAATNDEWYVDIVIYHDRYDGNVDYASANILGFLWYEDLPDESLTLENWKYAETGTIVNLDSLLTVAGIDNVADVYKRKVLRDQLRARGWLI